METYNPCKIKIPPRFAKAKFSDVPKDIQKHVEALKEHRRGLYLHGDCGVGKTHLVFAMSQKLALMGIHHKVVNSTKLLQDMRSDFDKRKLYPEYETVMERLEDFKGVLAIDDIGAEKLTDWVAETFYMIVNKRYENMTPMIFTSNYNLDELSQRIGDRIPSRIVEMCKVVNLDGEDRRLKLT